MAMSCTRRADPSRWLDIDRSPNHHIHLVQPQSMASSKIFETGRNSDNKPTVTIHLHASGDNQDTLTNEYVFASEKGFLGPSSNPTDQSGFANKENTVFGVSYEPVKDRTICCGISTTCVQSRGRR